MTFKNYLFSILLFCCAVTTISAQNPEASFMDNVRFGGSFNLGFSNNYTTIGISPSAIYDFNQQFSAGVGLSYLYANCNDCYDYFYNEYYDYSSNILGGSLIALYNPFYGLQVSAELEQMHVNRNYDIFLDETYWNPALYLGLAYNTGNISFGLRYDVLYNNNKSIYGSAFTPVFRAYF